MRADIPHAEKYAPEVVNKFLTGENLDFRATAQLRAGSAFERDFFILWRASNMNAALGVAGIISPH